MSGAATTLCRCWRIARADGVVMGFTDHDGPLSFDGTEFRPTEALSARAIEETTGLSVNNSEAAGALSGAGLTEADILAGRFDRASVEIFEVDWSDTARRRVVFFGELGEIERAGSAFKAELRGLAEALNTPQGRLFQQPCRAILGDGECRVALCRPEFSTEAVVEEIAGAELRLSAEGAHALRWFERGRLVVLSGDVAGAVRAIRGDTRRDGLREVELWDGVPGLAVGDRVRLEAGCDKRAQTCAEKFGNMLNFRGFPHLPGEDWLFAYPVAGGSR